MNSAPVELRPCSSRRWWGVVVLILIVQLGLIFWLGETSPIRARPATQALTLSLADDASAELLALHDPTRFVLPPPERHSSLAWQKAAPPQNRSITWPEPASPPPLAAAQAGVAFNRLFATNEPASLPLPTRPKPQPTLPDLVSRPLVADQSAVRLEGALAGRRLLTPLRVRSWTNPDILTHSVVRLLVNADGLPQSVTLLSGSGSREADRYALEQAGAARFEPLPRNPIGPAPSPTASLSSGRMLFLWHTLPLPPTNGQAVAP